MPASLRELPRLYWHFPNYLRCKNVQVELESLIQTYLVRGSIIVRQFGGLRLRNYRAVAGNHKFSSRFSVFACFCGGYSNRVKRLRRLSGNFILLKASLFNKGLPFRACEQPIRRQNLFVRWLLNGVIETICSVLKILWSLWGEIRLLS